jgi:GNAT superfamily N-acetyltransferase
MKLRQMRQDRADLAQVDQLLRTAYGGPSRSRDLLRYHAAQPDGMYAITDGAEIVAFAAAICYGPFCWLGLVATDPGYRRRGLATQLSAHIVEWARRRGCRTIALDASDAGRPVYERLGFEAVGETAELIALGSEAAASTSDVRQCGPEDVTDLLRFDHASFGGDRARLLEAFVEDPAFRCHIVTGSSGVSGFLFVGTQSLGPGAAVAADTAITLVLAAQHAGARGRLIVPMESRYLRPLVDVGLREERRLTHMRLGDLTLPGDRGALIAQSSYAAG